MDQSTQETRKEYTVVLSEIAIRNIDEITGYIAFINHQPGNAIKVGDAIFETIDRIALRPFAFKECPLLPTKTHIYRQAHCYNWLIIYRVAKEHIMILGIIHGSRQPSRHDGR